VRKPIIAGNWKMNLNRAESVELAAAVVRGVNAGTKAEVVVCPPFVYLEAVRAALHGSSVSLGCQNAAAEPNGALTGEISMAMSVDIGCRYVILGHSERRQILGETDEKINKKAHAALQAKLIPIVCVGETLEERESGRTAEVVRTQFDGSLKGITGEQLAGMVLAYEPVWAIGTGKVATPEQAEEVHSDLRKLIENRYNAEVSQAVRIQYGGSVKPENAASLLSQPNIDGALVGGASLKADSFLGIVAGA
jgi:triosephosphate isomerase (TIM)